MCGTKKKPISQAEKSQSVMTKKGGTSGGAGGASDKKTKEVRLARQQAKQQALVAPKIDDKGLQKTLGNMKAITMYGTAKALGLNASVASYLLRTLESRNVIKKVGGFSGHYIYSSTSSS
jgi:small subunit ribosomal protein S25e